MSDISNSSDLVRRRMTKQSLAILSHTLETAAVALGPSAMLIGSFQHETYFAPQASSFRRLDAHGVATIAAYAGADPASSAAHVTLASDDPLTRVWAAVLVSDTLCGFVHAVDLHTFGDTRHGLEPARLFDAEVGFSPARTRAVAGQLIDQLLRAGLDPRRAALPTAAPPDVTTHPAAAAWVASMEVLTDRLDKVSTAWRQEHERATRDPLTGLSNREGLHRWSGNAGSSLPNGPIGLLVFDMNGFKLVNDHLGHDAGDAMLERVARVISQHTRRDDLAVRWGGDEFLLLCPGVDDRELLVEIGRRISDEIATIEISGMRASVSYGVDVCTQRPIDLTIADAAMYRAKRVASR